MKTVSAEAIRTNSSGNLSDESATTPARATKRLKLPFYQQQAQKRQKTKQSLSCPLLVLAERATARVADAEYKEFETIERIDAECKQLGIAELIECPICFEDIPNEKRATLSCCGKLICTGCQAIVNEKRLEARMRGDEAGAERLLICPCCRGPIPTTDEQITNLLLKRAEQGCSNSQFTLGHNYEHGKGVYADLYKAAYWFRRSAEQGHTIAQYEMGRFHLLGRGGCDQSDATADKFFALAAAKHDPHAQFMLAQRLKKNGRYAEARQWSTLSAAQGATKTCKVEGKWYVW